MADICYVCMSDMHLGEEDNLLTNVREGGMEVDPTRPSPVLERLVDCLDYIINRKNNGKRPTLILNGDILELALCTTDLAAMAFEQFIKLTMREEKELFQGILYIPGNHDHHLWETAGETQYMHHVKDVQPGEELEPPRHTTNLFLEHQKIKVPSVFLRSLLGRFEHLKDRDKGIDVFYPNLGLKAEDGSKCVLFTHGHYIERIYMLMTIVKALLFPGQEAPLK